MKIVIDIPFNNMQDMCQWHKDGICALTDIEVDMIAEAIVKGVILPKGHGRLIDADAINIHDVSPTYGMEVYGVTQDDIEYEPTIIEADTESEE